MIERIDETPLWEHLKRTEKPIVLYGMGDGADMVISVLEKNGIEFKDVFASDKFVRGHFFRGIKVKKLSEIEELYGSFIILTTFAVHDKDMLEKIKAMSEKYELYSPTVSIIADDYFNREFLEQNDENLERAYSLLSDEKSRETFINVLKYKLSGKPKYLFNSTEEKGEIYKTIFPLRNNEAILDLGAYDGDTIREFTSVTKSEYKRIIAFEPDEKNFKKLKKKTEGMENLTLFNLGAWDKEETLYFSKKGARGSRAEEGGIPMRFNSVDNIVSDEITFIKMDIEGAELRALEGAKETIKKYRPKLYVCAYHKDEDMFTLPLKIKELLGECEIYYRHHPYIPAWESNFYVIPL